MAREIKILLLWQGTNAKRTCSALMADFPKAWTGQGALSFHMMEVDPGDWLQAITALIIDSDFAVAILGPESRSASNGAGNLWLEVGVWLGHRSLDDLYIGSLQKKVTIDGEDSSSERDVLPPSHIPAQRVKAFTQHDDLVGSLTRWLHKRLKARGASRETYSIEKAVERVAATLGEGFGEWLKRHARLCANGPWAPSIHLLTFVAELLRMGRANRELADLSAYLNRVGIEARSVALQERAVVAPSGAHPVALEAKVTPLHDALLQLSVSVEVLLRPRYRDADATWSTILGNFLVYRRDRSQRVPVASVPQKGRIERFVSRAFEYLLDAQPRLRRPDDTSSSDPVSLLTDALVTTLQSFGDLELFAQDAFALARYCEEFRIVYFDRTRLAMRQHFDRFSFDSSLTNSLESIVRPIASLTEASRGLPHNDQKRGWPVPIWPNDAIAVPAPPQ